MADVQKHSVLQYYEQVRRGIITNNAGRIMRYMLNYGEGGKTRHEICDNYFCVWNGHKWFSRDSGKPIHWQSLASPVIYLIENGYLLESEYEIDDPVTGNPAKLLFPAHVNPNLLRHAPDRFQPKLFEE